jgi:hypothetical protein
MLCTITTGMDVSWRIEGTRMLRTTVGTFRRIEYVSVCRSCIPFDFWYGSAETGRLLDLPSRRVYILSLEKWERK